MPEVRATIADDPGCPFRRRKNPRGTTPATLAEVARHWVMIDVDKWPLPPWAEIADDPESVIDVAVRDLLPEPFHDAMCFWQLSSSAGIRPGVLKVHLFFWLEQPVSNELLRDYSKAYAPQVDTTLFNAVQPHYIADPLFEGRADPLPRRTGWRKGLDDMVRLPPLDAAELRRSRYMRNEEAVHRVGLSTAAASTVDGALALLGDGDGLGGFHMPLRKATWLYACRTPADARDDAALKAKIRTAIAAAPRNPSRSLAEIEGYCSDLYLDRLIDGAYAVLAARGSAHPDVIKPYYAAPIHGIADARRAIRTAIVEFLTRGAAWLGAPEEQRPPPEQAAASMEVGGGKSTISREELVPFVAMLKAKALLHRVLWLVPTHKLGAEAAQHFRNLTGLIVAVWRGRAADNPSVTGEAMCLDLDSVDAAISAGENIETSVCGKPEGPKCRFFDLCAFQKQKAEAARADVVIAAHNVAFSELPQPLRNGHAITVFDESWWQCGLNSDWELTIGTLSSDPLRYPVLNRGERARQVRDDEATNDLHSIRAKVQKALEAAGDGYLHREALVSAGVTPEVCRTARGLEWRRRVEGLMRPGMPLEERKAAAERAALNAQLPRIAAFWTELEALLNGEQEATGRIELVRKETARGAERLIKLHVRRDMNAHVASKPILTLDATLPEQNIRQYLPRLKILADVRIKAPHQIVRHVVGGFGKTSLIQNERQSTEENRRRKWKVAEIRDFIALHSNGEPTLVVTYKELEAEFASLPNVQVAHFNAVAGLDLWRNVRHVFIIGRPLPRAEDVRIIAAALSGRPVPAAEPIKETR